MVCPFTAGKGSGVSEVLCACGAVKSCGGRGGGGSGCGSGLVAVGAGVAVARGWRWAWIAVGADAGLLVAGAGCLWCARALTHASQETSRPWWARRWQH